MTMGDIFRVGKTTQTPLTPKGRFSDSLIFLHTNKFNFALQKYTKWKNPVLAEMITTE